MIRIVAIVGARPQFIRATAGSHYALLMQSILPGIPLVNAGDAGFVHSLIVLAANGDAPLNFPVKPFPLGQNNRTLQGVHAAADANAGVHIAPALPMYADLPAGLGNGVVTGEDRTAGSHYALLMQSILPGIPLAGKVLFGLWQILPGPYAAGGAHPLAGIVS